MIEVILGDITTIKADAIVNAANKSLMGGGGVDGAIHRAGGPVILDECKKIIEFQGECQTGQAVITGAGNLPAMYVIHTAGPIWLGGNHGEKEKLSNCYINSFLLADKYKCESIAFPNISTGIYGFPKDLAAEIAVDSISQVMIKSQNVRRVVFVCFEKDNYQLIQNELKNL